MSFRGDHAGLGENRFLSGGAGKLEWLADLPHPSCCGNCREVMRVPKEDWGFLNEKAFEAALQASVPERLPDKVAAVTP